MSNITMLSNHFEAIHRQHQNFLFESITMLDSFKEQFASYLNIHSSIDRYIFHQLIPSDSFVTCKITLNIPYEIISNYEKVNESKSVVFVLRIEKVNPKRIILYENVFFECSEIHLDQINEPAKSELQGFFKNLVNIITQINWYNSREIIIGEELPRESGIISFSKSYGV